MKGRALPLLAAALLVLVGAAVLVVRTQKVASPDRFSGERYSWEIETPRNGQGPITPKRFANVSDEDLTAFPLLKEALDHRQPNWTSWGRPLQPAEMAEANRTIQALRARIPDFQPGVEMLFIQYREVFYALHIGVSVA